MQRLYGTFWRLLSQRTMVFEGPSAAIDAKNLRVQQRSLYDKVFRGLRDVKLADKEAGIRAVSFSNGTNRILEMGLARVSREPPSDDAQPDGRVVLRWQLPILTDDRVEDFFRFLTAQHFTEREAKFVPSAFAAAVVVELGTVDSPFVFDQIDSNEKLTILSQIAEYTAAKAIIELEPTIAQRYEPEIASLKGQLSNAAAAFEKERADQRGAFDALAAASMDLDEKQRNVDEAVQAAKQRLLNFEASVRAELQLDRARLNWGTRHKEARRSFLIASSLLATVLPITLCAVWLVGPAIVEFVNRPSLINFLPGGSGVSAIGHQVARLAIVSFPIVVFLWLLKVLVRFFMRSMLLMDDARQRETMLDTYFLLSGQGRADERDRPLILWALFRQTPGHGPDGIEPPDFTDVINAGFNRAKMPS